MDGAEQRGPGGVVEQVRVTAAVRTAEVGDGRPLDAGGDPALGVGAGRPLDGVDGGRGVAEQVVDVPVADIDRKSVV